MTNEYMPTIFHISPSFSNASYPSLKVTYMLSKILHFPKGLERNYTCWILQQKEQRFSGKISVTGGIVQVETLLRKEVIITFLGKGTWG